MGYMGAGHIPQRTVVLLRLSDDRTETGGLERQEEDCLALAERLGWTVAEVIPEESVSAYRRKRFTLPDGSVALRTNRPKFRKIIAGLTDGTYDALIAYDLDRAVRDPRDLEDLVDLAEQHGVQINSVTGSLRLDNDSAVSMARVMVAMANKSSRDTGRRVARRHQQLAQEGKPSGGGYRAYGYTPEMEIVPEEAEIIKEIHRRVTGKEEASLFALSRDFNARKIPTVRGKKWGVQNVKRAATKAAVAGLRVHKGEIIGKATWDAILSEKEWADLCAKIAETGGSDPTLKFWLTGCLFCGLCGKPLKRWGGREPDYKCAKTSGKGGPKLDGCGHLSIRCAQTEAVVTKDLLAALTSPAGRERMGRLLSAPQDRDPALLESLAEDDTQLRQLTLMFARKEIPLADYTDARKLIEARKRSTQARLSQHAPKALKALLAADDITAAWEALQPTEKREVVRCVAPNGFTVLPHSGKRPMRFEPERIQPRSAPPTEPEEVQDPE